MHTRTADSWTLAASIVELSDNFKNRLIEGYDIDPEWKRILEVLKTNKNLPDQDASTLAFRRHDDELIYYMDPELSPRLCISDHDGLIKKVFQLAHDELGYPGYHRAHERLTQGLYIRRLSTQLHEYLRHCPMYQLHQTPHYRPYGNM